MTFTDAELRAYLEGALGPEASAALERALEEDRALEARLLALEPLAAPVRAAFEDVPGEERIAAIRADLVRPSGGLTGRVLAGRVLAGRVSLVAGVAAAFVAIGFALASLTGPRAAPSWQDQVAQYQALYAPETIAHLQSDAALLEAQLARASAALGREIALADVSGVAGLTLRRAQILRFEETPLVQIVYATETGTPVALCILASPAEGVAAPSYADRAGLPTSHWADGRYGYMVLGRLEAGTLGDVTEHFAALF